MGRPPKRPEDKRQSVTFRLDPDMKRAIEAAAKESGRSVTAEMEARLTALEAFDAEGVELVRVIGKELQAIMSREAPSLRAVTKKSWHNSLKLWAAFKEMLLRGPIEDMRPERLADDEAATETQIRLLRLSAKRRELVHEVQTIGVSITEDHKPKTLPKRGGLFSLAFADLSPREITRKSLEILPDSELKSLAFDLLEQIQKLDAEIDQAEREFSEHVKMFRDAEKEGRDLYRQHLTTTAIRQQSEGKPFRILDLFQLWTIEP